MSKVNGQELAGGVIEDTGLGVRRLNSGPGQTGKVAAGQPLLPLNAFLICRITCRFSPLLTTLQGSEIFDLSVSMQHQ